MFIRVLSFVVVGATLLAPSSIRETKKTDQTFSPFRDNKSKAAWDDAVGKGKFALYTNTPEWNFGT